MCSDVRFEVTRQCKAFIAQMAAVGLVTGVQYLMISQVRLFAEPAATGRAFERPGSAVHVHVTAQVARCWERLGAKCTFVRLFLRKEVNILGMKLHIKKDDTVKVLSGKSSPAENRNICCD